MLLTAVLKCSMQRGTSQQQPVGCGKRALSLHYGTAHFPISYEVSNASSKPATNRVDNFIARMNQAASTQTPSMPAEVPYWNQNDGAASQPAKDLESEDGLTRGQWQVGFWECFTDLMPNCFMVTCCSCISMAQIADRLGVASYSKALAICLAVVLGEYLVAGLASTAASSTTTVETNYTNSGTAVTYSTNDGSGTVLIYRGIMVLVRVVFALFVMHLRKATRQRFQIPGNSREDFFASLCCSCCVLAQMATHLKSYKPGSCDFRPVADTLPPYSE